MNTSKDIVQVSAYYPPHLGGQENVVQGLAQQLAGAGHRVRVITSSQGGGTLGDHYEGEVLVSRLPSWVFGHAPIMPRLLAELFKAVKATSVVHLHIGQAFTPEVVWLTSKLRRCKYVAELHIDFEPSGPLGVLLPLYKQLILKRVLRSAALLIVLNKKTLDTMREVYGYKGTIKILHNGIDEAFFAAKRQVFASKPPKVLRLLFVGRLSKQKNILTLIHAVSLTEYKVHLDLVGSGEQYQEVKDTIAKLGLNNVVMHGRQDQTEIITLYKTCDALIMPSLYEAQPLVLLEAMAARIPIIGTNVVGVAEHLREAGIIVEPTISGLIDGIEQYYHQYPTLPAMVERGRALAETFRWRNTLKGYEAAYEAVSRS